MLLVGLTGNIGSGKSTVAQLLSERGATIIDADVLARRAVEATMATPATAATRRLLVCMRGAPFVGLAEFGAPREGPAE